MALKAELTLEEFEELSEPLKTEEIYEKTTTKVKTADGEKDVEVYSLKLENVENTGNLLSALEKRKAKEIELNTKVKELERKVKEAEEAKKNTEKEKAIALQRKMEEEGRYQEVSESYKRQLAEEREENLRILAEKESRYKTVLLDKEVKTYAVTQGGVLPEMLEDFYKIHKERFDIGPNGEIICLDRYGKSNGLPLDKQFSELRDLTKWAVKAERKGGGSQGGPGMNTGHNGSTPTYNLKDGSSVSPTPEMMAQMKRGNFIFQGFNQ